MKKGGVASVVNSTFLQFRTKPAVAKRRIFVGPSLSDIREDNDVTRKSKPKKHINIILTIEGLDTIQLGTPHNHQAGASQGVGTHF